MGPGINFFCAALNRNTCLANNWHLCKPSWGMSSRLVKQQLADLQQSSTKTPSTAAGVAKRKRRKAAKKAAAKVPTVDVEATRQRNLRYYKSGLASESTAATAALMTEVQHVSLVHTRIPAGLAVRCWQQQ